MTETRESELLLDIMSISRKYGAETIGKLNEKLRNSGTDESVYRLLGMLQNRELVLGAVSRSRWRIVDEAKLSRRLGSLREENRELLSRFAGDLYSEKLFSSKNDLLNFAIGRQINLHQQATRQMFVSLLIDYVMDLPEDSMRPFVEDAYRKAFSRNSLENWAKVILKK